MIQHLEGGIVKRLLVGEGDTVSAGQTLIELDDTLARTQVNRLEKQEAVQTTTLQRLIAERDDIDHISLPERVEVWRDDPRFQDLVEEQVKEFQARFDRYVAETGILRQRVSTLNVSMDGLLAQKSAIDRQLTIVAEELIRKKTLVDKGLTNHFEYTQIQRNEADLTGQRGSVESELAALRSQIVEAQEQIERLKTQRVEQAVSELAKVRSSLADIEEQLEAARTTLDRTQVRSPIDGVIVLSVHNAPGSVVTSGEKVIEILPTGSPVIVEARIGVRDIDNVHRGQQARLKLTALNSRLTPEVAGRVLDVSADRLVDPNSHEEYFRAKLTLVENLPANVDVEQLYAGMPVEAFISVEERTFLSYLVRPLLDSMQRSFVER